MIASRSFSRIHCSWKSANVLYVLPKSVNYFQGGVHYQSLSCIRKMSGSNDGLNTNNHSKKQRMITTICRPVSSQSISSEGCLEKDVKACEVIDCNEKSDVGVHTSSGNINVQNSGVSDGLIPEEAASLTLSSIVMQSNNHSEALEEKTSVISVDPDISQSQCTVSDLKSFETICKEEVDPGGVHELDIETCKVNKAENHSTCIEVDASLIRFVKGKGGCTQKQIEEEAGVKIIFPSSKGESAISIEGTSTESVTRASEMIKIILEEAIKSPKLDYSHFISLPLAIHPELVEKLNDFQNTILGTSQPGQVGNQNSDSSEDDLDDENMNRLDGDSTIVVNLKAQDDNKHVKVELDKTVGKNDALNSPRSSILSDTPTNLGIDKSIFIKPKTFHLTVLMLKLWNKERVAAATEVLQSVSSKVKDALDGRPVSVRLKGLDCMKGSQAKARVLYAPVEETGGEGRLLCACQVIIEAYVDAGLVLEKDAQQKLKLHATLMNARHRKRKERTKRFDSFDARDIYKHYSSEEWGEYLIREAHLSQRFVLDDNGYYHCCTSIPFPENMQIE